MQLGARRRHSTGNRPRASCSSPGEEIVNAKPKPANLSHAVVLLVSLAVACGGDESDEKRSAAQMSWGDDGNARLDLSGQWVSNDFTCGAARLREFISIEQFERDVTGVKVTGDDCVPAGYVSFEGQLPRADLTYLDLPVRFPVRGYSGKEGRPETIAVTSTGEALVTAPEVMQLVFSNVSVRLTRSDEDPSAPTATEPTTAGGESVRNRPPAGGRADSGVPEDEAPEGDAGTRRTGRSPTSSTRADAGASDADDEPTVGNEPEAGQAEPDDEAAASDAAVSDAGPTTSAECTNPFLPGASCDHLAQCGCAEGENCRFDGLDPPSCFPAGPSAEREPCTAPSDCDVGLTCAYDVCVRMCEIAGDCDRGECVDAEFDGTDVEGLRFCVEQCDPVLSDGCYDTPTPTDSCQPCGSGRMCMPGEDLARCVATGDGIAREPGAACTEDSQCFAAECYGGTCQRWCRTATDCLGLGESCEFTGNRRADLGDEIGHCTGSIMSSF